MSFYRRIKYFLVHSLKLTNKEAQELIDNGKIKIDDISITENCPITENSEIKVNEKIVRAKKEMVYLLFNKPAGFESTLNKTIEKNISSFFNGIEDLSIAGRLDKQSQGLLILSNDGKWVENLCNPKFEKEKEYLVTLDQPVTDLFIESFKNGVEINGNYVTKKCVCQKINETTVKVILKEGKNRQIRKMCKTLKVNVLFLKRVRIDQFLLGDLAEGEFKFTKI